MKWAEQNDGGYDAGGRGEPAQWKHFRDAGGGRGVGGLGLLLQ